MNQTTPEQKEARDHDKWVSGLDAQTLTSAASDLKKRRYWNRRDQEHRWGMSRLAAIIRELVRRNISLHTL